MAKYTYIVTTSATTTIDVPDGADPIEHFPQELQEQCSGDWVSTVILDQDDNEVGSW